MEQDVKSQDRTVYGLTAIIVLSVILVCMFSMNNRGEETPIIARANFFESLEKGEYEKARKFLNSETSKAYSDMQLDKIKNKLLGNKLTSGGPDNLVIDGKKASEILTTMSGDGPTFGKTIVTYSKGIFGWKIDNINIGF